MHLYYQHRLMRHQNGKKIFVEKLTFELNSGATSISKTTRELLGRLKPNEYQLLALDADIELNTLSPEQHQQIAAGLEQMYGRLQDLGPQFAPIIDEMNDIAKKYISNEDLDEKTLLETEFKTKKVELDAKLNELDEMRPKKKIILKLLSAGVATTAIGGIIITGIFETVANALGSDTTKDRLPKLTDPKDIIESGLGQLITDKLKKLATYFHDMYLNSSRAFKALWHMIQNAVQFLQNNIGFC